MQKVLLYRSWRDCCFAHRWPWGPWHKEISAEMNDATKQKVLARVRRVVGQLEGVSRMIEQDRALVDVLLQLASAQAALGQAGKIVLRAYVERCVTSAIAADAPAERKQKADELVTQIARYSGLGRGKLT